MTSISELKAQLIPGTKAVITAHYNPDSDAIGSTLAFQGYLAKKGIQATVAVPSRYLLT
jgi:nanoRNase/pAp phosphatase (c-di-AMP/oligoRNAs hydrolase)